MVGAEYIFGNKRFVFHQAAGSAKHSIIVPTPFSPPPILPYLYTNRLFIMPTVDIYPLTANPQVITALTDMLIEVVAGGGSVSFMHPLAPETATAFWTAALASAARGERIILGAFAPTSSIPATPTSPSAANPATSSLVGTVTLLVDCPQNQPHRAEIAKLMTRVTHRGQGIARLLMHAAETIAIDRGRTLLTLDTAVEGGAASLYEGLGYQKTGVIPDYALLPHGGLTGTIIYWKRLGQ
jgi:ribosomal protein S18 acetylase RimI-like enzyme